MGEPWGEQQEGMNEVISEESKSEENEREAWGEMRKILKENSMGCKHYNRVGGSLRGKEVSGTLESADKDPAVVIPCARATHRWTPVDAVVD
jgi:hypothetical protein